MADTGYQVAVDSATSSEWSEMLGRFDDANVYQTWSYGAVHWGEKNLSHLVLRRSGEVVAMAQLRIIRIQFLKCGIAYMRWGPVCQLKGRDLEPEVIQRMARALHDEYVRKRGLFLRILPDAFSGTERANLFRSAFMLFGHERAPEASAERTIRLDLAPSLDELRKKLDGKWRGHLNRSEKNNLTVAEGTDDAEYRVFVDLYEKMWSRKQFETTVDVQEFGRIARDLPPEFKLKILICRHEGAPVSGIVCSTIGNTAIYLLGATPEEGKTTKAAFLTHWTIIKWLKENGFRYYDLGGIDPEGNPGVYNFKRGFSGDDLSRIGPFEACEGFFSSACIKMADFARNGGLKRIAARLKGKNAAPIPQIKGNEAAAVE